MKFSRQFLDELMKNCTKVSINFIEELLRNHGNFVKFARQFLDELMKNCTETSKNFRTKLRRNPEKILEIFWALRKISPVGLQSFSRHRL